MAKSLRFKSLAALCISGAIFVVPSTAAAQSATGTILQIIVQSGGVVFFNTSSIGTGRASCAPSGRWAFSVNGADGQAMLSTLLVRQSSRQSISVYGKGTCSVWSDSEDVYWS